MPTTKTRPAKKPAKPRTIKVVEDPSPRDKKTKTIPNDKRLSAIDAAFQVLDASSEPMNTRQLVEAMSAKGLWTSPGGKTPHATLYSAILREIATKGSNARFTKADRGKFTANESL